MVRIKLEQNKGEISNAVTTLLSDSGTDLAKFCRKEGLTYGKISKRLQRKYMYLDDLMALVKMIDSEADVSVDINISISANGKEIFTQKTER